MSRHAEKLFGISKRRAATLRKWAAEALAAVYAQEAKMPCPGGCGKSGVNCAPKLRSVKLDEKRVNKLARQIARAFRRDGYTTPEMMTGFREAAKTVIRLHDAGRL